MPRGDNSTIVNVELIPYLHMVWDNKRMDDGELLYKRKPEGISEEMIFDDNEALAHLLAKGQVFINNHWWMKENELNEDEKHKAWPEEACRTFSINVNCNDVFAWGCADAEEMMEDELEDVYQHYHKDPSWGAAVWCIKKRGELPQKPVYNAIMKAGIWNLDEMGLRENSYDAWCKQRYSNEN